MKKSILKDKSKAFALRIIKMVEFIQSSQREYVLTKQVLRSGTSIGANVHEAFFGQSLPDFISKLSISRKECGETQYWLELLYESSKISESEYNSIQNDCIELGKILTSSIKTALKTLEERKNNKSSVVSEPSANYTIADISEPSANYTIADDSDDLEIILTHYSL